MPAFPPVRWCSNARRHNGIFREQPRILDRDFLPSYYLPAPPIALERQYASQDFAGRLRRVRSASVRDREARAIEPPHARDFALCVPNFIEIYRLLCFEHSVDALGRHNLLLLEIEDEWRVLPVEDDDIDLVAKIAFAVHHVC